MTWTPAASPASRTRTGSLLSLLAHWNAVTSTPSFDTHSTPRRPATSTCEVVASASQDASRSSSSDMRDTARVSCRDDAPGGINATQYEPVDGTNSTVLDTSDNRRIRLASCSSASRNPTAGPGGAAQLTAAHDTKTTAAYRRPS